MELSTQEAEIPMPINSVYGGVHVHAHAHAHAHGHGHDQAHQGNIPQHHHHHNYHHHHENQPSSSTSHGHNIIIPSSSSNNPNNGIPITITMPSNTNNGSNNTTLNLEPQKEDINQLFSNTMITTSKKPSIRYKECQKNHAASMGGNAIDGCGEFMPSGEDGTIESLTCSACNCHRNFHRKVIDDDNHHHHHHNHHNQHQHPYPQHIYLSTPHPHPHHIISTRGRKVILGSGGSSSSGGFMGYPMSRALPMNVSYQVGPAKIESDNHDHDHHQMVKRRFRTKFSQEQKEKMLEFAEKVGWKIQKQEDSVVQQFCQEIGVKRRVLKVWMHNNKHTLAKKIINNNPNSTNTTST